MCDLFDESGLEQEIRENVQARNRLIKESTLDWRPLFDQMLAYGERLKPWVTDISVFLAKPARRASRSFSRARREPCSTSIMAPIPS